VSNGRQNIMDGTFGGQYRELVSQVMAETQADAAIRRVATARGGWSALGLLLRPHRPSAGPIDGERSGRGRRGDYTLVG
jgi:hypothetical protein